jgi:hypothetical protein
VHGIWYSFDGQVIRGAESNRAADGFYLLDGTLIAHDEATKATQRRTISLKLAGQR